MIKKELVEFMGNNSTMELLVRYPTICPHCSKGISATYIKGISAYMSHHDEDFMYALFMCPVCEQFFLVCTYYNPSENVYEVLQTYPRASDLECKEFDENIAELSPRFCEIYNQAYQAEQNDLLEICGMGYRKALEFLVKDYAIRTHADDSEQIKGMLLAPCIDKYMGNESIKQLAKASAWIGNDETHYVRKHENHDYQSLKAFIDALVSIINSELQVQKAAELISSANSSAK